MFEETPYPAGMLDADRQRLHQLLAEMAMDDPDTQELRPENTSMFKGKDLTRAEKVNLMDLLAQFMSMTKHMPDQARRSELYKEFFDAIFSKWYSGEKPKSHHMLAPLRMIESSAQVGILRINHPINKYFPQTPERMAGQPAFLGLDLIPDEGGWRWIWTDRRGCTIDSQYINFLGLTRAEARRQAIANYDRAELKRITKYNLDLVVSVAQRRIARWAKHGPAYKARVDDVDRFIPGGIQKLLLARDWISHWSRVAFVLTDEMPPSEEEIKMPTDETRH
ncbi:uncharacterized protein NECHADRAFT_77452 [Fusarium vanettenii 77-13-4]|uniref:Uncharacterized protein n=1 Tax=Fusarium vanettenii (strain ATCC MYA-4622 / CBS 123669 / FGSC 9596 / NRRL 45880 / 77-13-4) TaxID=660122 RepID=C7YL96_FUSV7|nr:uncharacterized protein NECHADRAFT_77452 [Fusarium vanettenii 77-13-4]EEU47221.1 hypothetical protein NECHADRAFT_77452 [Fusarium vanettenii 77-13-4]